MKSYKLLIYMCFFKLFCEFIFMVYCIFIFSTAVPSSAFATIILFNIGVITSAHFGFFPPLVCAILGVIEAVSVWALGSGILSALSLAVISLVFAGLLFGLERIQVQENVRGILRVTFAFVLSISTIWFVIVPAFTIHFLKAFSIPKGVIMKDMKDIMVAGYYARRLLGEWPIHESKEVENYIRVLPSGNISVSAGKLESIVRNDITKYFKYILVFIIPSCAIFLVLAIFMRDALRFTEPRRRTEELRMPTVETSRIESDLIRYIEGAMEMRRRIQMLREEPERGEEEAEKIELSEGIKTGIEEAIAMLRKIRITMEENDISGETLKLAEFKSAFEDTMDSIRKLISRVRNRVSALEEVSSLLSSVCSKVMKTLSMSISDVGVIEETLEQLDGFIRSESGRFKEFVEMLRVLRGKVADMRKSLSVIFELSEDITLLSFNASVIAAKGKELSTGFSVIASAIGELADRTKNSSKAIEAKMADVMNIVDEIFKSVSGDFETISKISLEDIISNIREIGIYLRRIGEEMEETFAREGSKIVENISALRENLTKVSILTEITFSPELIDQGKIISKLKEAEGKLERVLEELG